MAITQAMCSSFKEELLSGIHDMNTDVLKLALFTSAATLNAATTEFSVTNETSGTGYTSGGATLAGTTITLSGTTAFVDFSDVTFSAASITARGALIYNSSKADRAIAVYDFGEDKTSTSADFVVQMPTADATNAVVRIA